MIPLQRRYPGTVSIPHVALGEWPTPVTSWPEFGAAVGSTAGAIDVRVKRDDRSAAAYGGNKVRKLEFLLARALTEGRPAVVTFGGLGSNHVLATAIHGERLGLEVHAVLTPQAATPYLLRNLLADVGAGARLHPVERGGQWLERGEQVRAEVAAAHGGVEPLVIPFGGTSPEGTLGFVNAGFELVDQIEAGAVPVPDVIYVPLGSMGTTAGLAIALVAAGLPTRIQAVRVLPDDGSATPAAVAAASVALLRAVDAGFPDIDTTRLPVDVRDAFLGDGYAVPTVSGREAVALAAESGFELETTYTGKALSAMVADARRGALDGKTVLLWDTYNSRELSRLGKVTDLPPELQLYADPA